MAPTGERGSMSSERRVALVTGVGRREGIGFEVCRQLGARGLTVVLTARTSDKARALADALAQEGLDVTSAALEVTDEASRRAATEHVRVKFGVVDVLVNNAAGMGRMGETVASANLAETRAAFETTVFGNWAVTQAFLPLLRASKHPRIVNVSSGAGPHGDTVFGLRTGNGMGPSYATAKAALNALTSSLATELAGTGVLVNAVCPGFTATFPGAESMGARPVADGAASIVWAALLPDDGPTGGFFRDGEALPW
jgi:NAD(P)-dependent dehydrogenase (short-subunit alcohol dehydrogenase family)